MEFVTSHPLHVTSASVSLISVLAVVCPVVWRW